MSWRPSTAAMAWCGMLLVAAIAWLAYRPGLSGSFVFDDFAHLPALGATGPIDNAASLLRYLTSGQGDPTGRPLATASFLLDATDWPADPYPFKRTNVLLHALNGLLLFATLRQLGKALAWSERRRSVAALVAAAAWLLHPFFVSTVLYVIQREAMLPATFTLLALLSYLRARDRAVAGHGRSATSWLIVGVGACTLLATLSKANGVLIPLLVMVIHSSLPRGDGPQSNAFRKRCIAVLAPLAIAVPAYLAWIALSALGDGPIPIRGWSVVQRLLTEPAIVWHYMAQLWLLATTSSSLLHDDITVASSIFSPWYTLPALAGWLVLASAAWRWRQRAPSLAMAILFFICGHLIESTSLPLELYFDHRNYVPALLLFWPLGEWVARARSRTVTCVAIMGISALLASLTYANASAWGHPVSQAMAWASAHPASARAQAHGAQVEAASGRMREARSTIDRAAARFTGEPQIALNQINIHCRGGRLEPNDAAYARAAFERAQREPGPLLLDWMSASVAQNDDKKCAGLTRAAYESILDGATANPRIMDIAGRRQDVLHLRGVLALAWHEPSQALEWFDQALATAPTPSAALAQAAALGNAGYPGLGLRHLDYYATLPREPAHRWQDGMPWAHDMVLEHQRYWELERDRLRASLTRANELK